MADFVPNQRTKNALDNRKLNLSTKCPADQTKWSSLIWGIYANNPRITVYTNDPSDQGESKGYGKISANLDLPVFYMFLAKLSEVIDAKDEIKFKFENKNFIFPGGKRSEKPVTTSELWVGKDKDGIVWISVTAHNRPKIKFPFCPSDFHFLLNGDGSPVSAAEVSCLCAKAYVTILQNMMATMACNNYIEPTPKPQRGDSGGGWKPKQGGGNNSYEEEIPF